MTPAVSRNALYVEVLRRRWRPIRIGIGFVVVVVYWWAARGTEVSLSELIRGLPNIGKVIGQMFPPDPSVLRGIAGPVLETLQIGILATLIASLLAIPLGYFAASNMAPHRLVYLATRAVLNVFRGVSEIIWGLFFVVAVGLGTFPGVLALVIFSTGVIGKLLAEAVEAVDRGPIEAVRSTGASNWKVFLYGVWPQVMPVYLSYCLYYWDHNTRQATILGFVGAGGIGYTLFTAISNYEFEKATTAILVMVVLITIVDRLSWWLRRRFM
jgi:phosphonate transport system permease protein